MAPVATFACVGRVRSKDATAVCIPQYREAFLRLMREGGSTYNPDCAAQHGLDRTDPCLWDCLACLFACLRVAASVRSSCPI